MYKKNHFGCLPASTPAPKYKQKKNKHNVLIVFISSSQPLLKLYNKLELFLLLCPYFCTYLWAIQYNDLFAVTIYCVFVYSTELQLKRNSKYFGLEMRDVDGEYFTVTRTKQYQLLDS